MGKQTIKVLHLGTEISSSSAPLRIHRALKRAGADSQMLVLKNRADDDGICEVRATIGDKMVRKINACAEKGLLKKYPRRTKAPFSFGQCGISGIKRMAPKDIDLIHLHWINQYFLSSRMIVYLTRLGKPVVWTFHDSWPMTGGCHVRYGCQRFEQMCGCCPHLGSEDLKDITYQTLRKKKKKYNIKSISVVAPSKWMHENVKKSNLFGNARSINIGNPIDVEIFRRKERPNQKSDPKLTVLFGANGALELEYKGYQFFAEAMRILKEKNPLSVEKIRIKVFGSDSQCLSGLEGYEHICVGYLEGEEKMADLYSGADIYVFPSIDDNLPGTVMESLACETPVVAFDVGGLSDMVWHKGNGYLAEYKNSADLARGILWVMENNTDNWLGKNGRDYIRQNYNMSVIGQKYYEFYEKLLNQENR